MTASFPPDPLLAAAQACADAGSWTEALALLAPRASIEARDGESAVLYGEALMRTGDERQALAWLRTRMEIAELSSSEREAFRLATASVDRHIDRLVGGGRCGKLRRAAAALHVARGMSPVRA